MPLTLSPCTPPDAPAFTTCFLATYTLQPRHITTYASTPYAAQHAHYLAAFAAGIESQSHPTATLESHYLKVTDDVTGEWVAYAIWQYLPKGYVAEEDRFTEVKEEGEEGGMPEGVNGAMMKDFAGMTRRLRGEHEGRKGAHWLLYLLGTHPKHERRGAAGMLIRWAFPFADQGSKPCYVDGSSVGYALYKRCGFTVDVGEVSVNLDKYGDQGFGVHRWVAMMREPVEKPEVEQSAGEGDGIGGPS